MEGEGEFLGRSAGRRARSILFVNAVLTLLKGTPQRLLEYLWDRMWNALLAEAPGTYLTHGLQRN